MTTHRYDGNPRARYRYPLYYLNPEFCEAVARVMRDGGGQLFRYGTSTVFDVARTHSGGALLWPLSPQTEARLARIATVIGYAGPIFGAPLPQATPKRRAERRMRAASFSTGTWEQPITRGDPCPEDQVLRLHHALVTLLVPTRSWGTADLQIQRLDALYAAGYRKRREGSTDFTLWRHAQQASYDLPAGVLDHPSYMRHDDDPVIVCHSYAPREHVEAALPVICDRLSQRWRCDVRHEIGDRFNIYWPGTSDTGYEIRRPAWVRGPRRDRP